VQNVKRQASKYPLFVAVRLVISGLVNAFPESWQRRRPSAASLGSLVFCVLVAGAISGFAQGTEYEFELISPAPGIHVHLGRHEDITIGNAGDIANTGFIVGEQSVMVIDPGGSPQMGRRLQQAIRAVTDLPVSHVVLTHVHPDHIFGSGIFDAAEKIIVHERYPAALTQRAQFYLDRFAGLFADESSVLPVPTDLVQKTLEVDLGNRVIVVQAYPTAHTDHDLTVYDAKTRTLWASDLVFAQRIPSLDGSLLGWLEVSRMIAQSDAALVIPGHGSPGPLANLLLPQIRYLEILLRETREQVAANARLADAIDSVAQSEKERWLLHELHHAGNVTKAFTELEWE